MILHMRVRPRWATIPKSKEYAFNKWMFRLMMVLFFLLIGCLFGVAIYDGVAGVATKQIIEVKVVEAQYVTRGKGRREVRFYVENKYGQRWWAGDDDGLAASRCPSVIYNTFRPVWHNEYVGGLAKNRPNITPTRYINGMITFCPQAS